MRKPAARRRWQRSTSSQVSSVVSNPPTASKACPPDRQVAAAEPLHVLPRLAWCRAGSRRRAAPRCRPAARDTARRRPRRRPACRFSSAASTQPPPISLSASTNARMSPLRQPRRGCEAPRRGRARSRGHARRAPAPRQASVGRSVVDDDDFDVVRSPGAPRGCSAGSARAGRRRCGPERRTRRVAVITVVRRASRAA